jgi:vacuolar-type H+-ATPase subunit E/Vma4
MTFPEAGVPDPLAPLRQALLAAAERDAALAVAAADAEAEATRRDAAQEAEAIRREARTQGEADGREVLVAERARARRRARATVLSAQGDAYSTLRDDARAAVMAVRDDPDYPALRDRLAAQATAMVGAGATVTESADGGVVAEAPGRRAALTLTALADQVLDTLGLDLETLWTP